jgi:hypothetical protein
VFAEDVIDEELLFVVFGEGGVNGEDLHEFFGVVLHCFEQFDEGL